MRDMIICKWQGWKEGCQKFTCSRIDRNQDPNNNLANMKKRWKMEQSNGINTILIGYHWRIFAQWGIPKAQRKEQNDMRAWWLHWSSRSRGGVLLPRWRTRSPRGVRAAKLTRREMGASCLTLTKGMIRFQRIIGHRLQSAAVDECHS